MQNASKIVSQSKSSCWSVVSKIGKNPYVLLATGIVAAGTVSYLAYKGAFKDLFSGHTKIGGFFEHHPQEHKQKVEHVHVKKDIKVDQGAKGVADQQAVKDLESTDGGAVIEQKM